MEYGGWRDSFTASGQLEVAWAEKPNAPASASGALDPSVRPARPDRPSYAQRGIDPRTAVLAGRLLHVPVRTAIHRL